MNYQPRNNLNARRNNRYIKPLQITVVVIVVLIFVRLVVPSAFDSFFAAIFSPLWRMERSVSGDDFSASANRADLSSLVESQNSTDSVTLLQQENAELKALLGRTSTAGTLILAAVLKAPPLSAYDSLVIDLGSDENVKTGDKVFALASPIVTVSTTSTAFTTTSATSSPISSTSTTEVLTPIGTVAETSAASSKVSLFSSPGMKYSVEIGPDHIPATAIAQGGGMFEVQLAQGAHVNVGDTITIPDIETLTFGMVGAIVNDPTQPYMNVFFQEPVNIYQLRWVLVESDQTIVK
jgi:cell shape-determining protein MreC